MKKIVLGMALMVAAVSSLNVSARPQTQKSCDGTKKECLRKAKGVNEMEGLVLNEDQQGRLEALNVGYELSQKELQQNIREARAKGDTLINPVAEERNLRARYLEDLRQVIGLDNYAQFLSNYYVNQPMRKVVLKGDSKDKQVKRGHHDGMRAEARVRSAK